MQNKRLLLVVFALLLVLFLATEGVSASSHYTEDDLDADIGDLDDSLEDLEEHEVTEDDNAEELFDEDSHHLESFYDEEHALSEEEVYASDLATEMLDDEEAELEADVSEEFDEDELMENDNEDTNVLSNNELSVQTIVVPKVPIVQADAPTAKVAPVVEVQKIPSVQLKAPVVDVAYVPPIEEKRPQAIGQEAILAADQVKEIAEKEAQVQNVKPLEVAPVKSVQVEAAQEAKINAVALPVEPMPNSAGAAAYDPLAVDKSPNSIVMGLAGAFAGLLLVAIAVASLLAYRHKQQSLSTLKEDQMLNMRNGKRFTKPLLEREEQESPYIVMRKSHEV